MHSINVNIKYIEGIILNRLLKFDSSIYKTGQNVEKKYRLSSMKSKTRQKPWYTQDGKNVRLLPKQLNELQVPEIIRIAEENDCRSFLEVGGGC